MRASRMGAVLVFVGCVLATGVLVGCAAPGLDFSRAAYDQIELDQIQVDWADSQWEVVTGMFPDAQRPDVQVVRYIESDEWVGDVLAQCLEEQGYEVPEPPSKQAFLEGTDWNPFANVGSASIQEALVSRACPPIPPESGLQ